MLFAQPALMGCVDWGDRCDPEKGSGAAHGVFGSADKSDVPTEITERLRNDNGHRCEMHHRLSHHRLSHHRLSPHWAVSEKDRRGPSLRALLRVCLVIRGGCARRDVRAHGEEGRQCLRGFAVTRGGQSSHDLSICQKPPHNSTGNHVKDSGHASGSPACSWGYFP